MAKNFINRAPLSQETLVCFVVLRLINILRHQRNIILLGREYFLGNFQQVTRFMNHREQLHTCSYSTDKVVTAFSISLWVYYRSFELVHDKTNKMTCAPSEESDQPGYPPSLIREAFAVSSKDSKGPMVSSCGHRRPSDQTWRMPRLIWVFVVRTIHFVGFTVLRLVCFKPTYPQTDISIN